MIGTGLLLPRAPGRRAIASNAIRFGTISRLVGDAGGRLSYASAVAELRGLGLSGGSSLACIRRAVQVGEVVVAADGALVLPGDDGDGLAA